MNLYSLGKYFSIDTEGGEVKKWVSMINSALKAERSWGSHPRENLNRRAAGKEGTEALGKGTRRVRVPSGGAD